MCNTEVFNVISVRLNKDDEKKLYDISENEGCTKSDIVKDALERYFVEYDKRKRPYELGKNLFGKNGSGESDNSVVYKEKVRRKINEKMPD